MANIDVVRKRSNVWLWLIAAVVLAVLLFAFFAMQNGSTGATNAVSHLILPTPTVSAAVLA